MRSVVIIIVLGFFAAAQAASSYSTPQWIEENDKQTLAKSYTPLLESVGTDSNIIMEVLAGNGFFREHCKMFWYMKYQGNLTYDEFLGEENAPVPPHYLVLYPKEYSSGKIEPNSFIIKLREKGNYYNGSIFPLPTDKIPLPASYPKGGIKTDFSNFPLPVEEEYEGPY